MTADIADENVGSPSSHRAQSAMESARPLDQAMRLAQSSLSKSA
jgi:hypothetical protein